MIPGWAVDLFGHLVFWIGIPALFIFSAIAPFWFTKKILKQRFTIPNVIASLIVAVGLIALDIYLVYLGIVWLASAAFCGIYSC